MKTILQDIKTGEFKKAYLLFGEEEFLKKSYKNQLKAAMVGDDSVNYHYFEGKDLDFNEIISLADTMPFFGERRLIHIEDSGLFQVRKAGAKGNGANSKVAGPETEDGNGDTNETSPDAGDGDAALGSANASALADYLPRMPDTTCMMFVESKADKRSRLYRAVDSLGHAVELKRQGERQLAPWAGKILANSGRKITNRTMDFFLSRVGDDMENIRTELEKLISYTQGRDVVTDQDVETICTVQTADKVFDMVDAIVNRNTKKAMDLYEDLLMLREPPIKILILIARQFNQLLQVKEMVAQSMGRDAIASKLKLRTFVAGKLISQARNFSIGQILSYLELCVESDEAVKSGRMSDRMAVELLIAKQC